MLIHLTKLTKHGVRPSVFQSPYKYNLFCVSFSSYNLKLPETINDTANQVSAFLNKPNWQQNDFLKSLVSHMTPHVAYQVILLQGNDTHQGVRFFNWVCRHSTYCYDVESRILLLNLVASCALHGVVHKAIIELIKACSDGEENILKLIDALDELREVGFRLNYPCYSSLLMSLAKLDLGFLAYKVYVKMVADGFVVGAIDHRTMINALCKNGLLQAGEMFLCRVLKLGFSLDTHICTSLVLGHCRANDLQEAFKVFEIMSKEDECKPNSVTFSTLIHGLCDAGRLEEAFSLKEDMCEKGCQPSTHTYTVLIKALCDFALTGKALSLFDEMIVKGCKPNVHTYTVLIDRLCREGKICEANGLFKKMLQDGLFPGIVTYNALINGYCKQGRIIAAFELLALMEKRKCKPNIRTYNELMDGLCRMNKSYKALHLLERVVDNGLFPDEVTYNILMDGFCREGKLNLALKIFNSMSLAGLVPDGYSFTLIIDGLCKQGKPELANGFFGLMVKKGISPDEVTITALTDGHCKTGQTGDALMIFERMVENTILRTPHVLNSFLDVFCKENKLKEEYAMFGKILKYGLVPSVVTYTILIDGLFRAGKISPALSMLEMMKLAGCLPNVYTYTVVINGLCKSGRVKEAEMLFFKMFDLGVYPNHITYTILVKAHANASRLDHALKIVSIMVTNGCQLNSHIYSTLLAGFVSSNKASGLLSVGSGCHRDASSVHMEHHDDDYEHSLNNVLREMDVEHAFRLRNEIERCGGSTTDFYNFLIVELCKAGRLVEADSIAKDIVKSGLFPDKAISIIIEYYCREHKYNSCIEFMNLILNNGFVPSLASYCSVIQSVYNGRMKEEAERLVSDLFRYSGIEEKTSVLHDIEFLLRGDEPEKYLDLLNVLDRQRPIF
ncbi:Pentatricopeptide repeat-containing protein [Melia azedarach]|uniref:Pentatricopeptide repeat-containing protein n=2 Tax=Melia azedarach TaxID=155640 RepID=A0ACC1YY37_MELAZ|nr:Pentatricopeptide repeat-containing protein [Melia azedarach]